MPDSSPVNSLFYLASNGRCGTQYIARQLGYVADGEKIVHESHGRSMSSRYVFRAPDSVYYQIGRTPLLQVYLSNIQRTLNKNKKRYIHCGWPAFAYVPYFQERYGESFEFAHLVRNPYVNAASHSTHHTMLEAYLDDVQKQSKIFGSDPNVLYKQFAGKYAQFSTFERQLFHWLEVTAFIHEQRALPGYRGLFRFEDIFNQSPDAVNSLLSLTMGRPVQATEEAPFDRVHRQQIPIGGYDMDTELMDAVDALARELGYSQAELDAAKSPLDLAETYGKKRHDLPCDPRIKVIAASS